MGNGASSNTLWSSTYRRIKFKHDLAYKAIEQAITLEEQEQSIQAIEKYKQGIKLIDEALNIQVRCPDNPDHTWQSACAMIQKLKKTRAEVMIRINSIQPEIPEEQPPTYDEATSSESGDDAPKTYKDLATALNELSIDPNVNLNSELIYIHEDVNVYFISPDGRVESTQERQTLRISTVEGDEASNAPRAVLQVGDWIYPLVPGVSPCYRTEYGAFILPNVHAEVPGSSIGIILPSDADAEVLDLLENILHGIISAEAISEIKSGRKRREIRSEPQDLSSRISGKIVNGAWYVSQGLITGAEKVGSLLNSGTPKVINQLEPANGPTNVPPGLTKGIKIAECATNKAAQVTGFVADKIGIATSRLGQFLAPHIQKQGTRLLATGFQMPEEEASHKVQGVLTIAAGAVEGFSTVYRGLETSASILGRNLKDNTVKIVQHKYGPPAGNLAEDTFDTMGNVYTISRNTRIITPKGLAKNAIKNTGKAVVYGYNTAEAGTSGNQIEPANVPTSNSLVNLNTKDIDIQENKK